MPFGTLFMTITPDWPAIKLSSLHPNHYLSSLEATNQQFADYIRSHWGIENQLHWCLDVVFGEDDSRIRQGHSARNMSLMRRFTLNLLRQETSKAIAAFRITRTPKFLLDKGFSHLVCPSPAQVPL